MIAIPDRRYLCWKRIEEKDWKTVSIYRVRSRAVVSQLVVRHTLKTRGVTYNSPTTAGSVDTEADWKAEHAVDPCSGMQAAIAVGDADSRESRSVRILS
jgi:hypothetical protein